MYFYKLDGKMLVSYLPYENLKPVNEEEVINSDRIYILNRMDPQKSRKTYCVSDPSLFTLDNEGLGMIKASGRKKFILPDWLISKIQMKNAISINTCFPNWDKSLDHHIPKVWRINVVGLGDVGCTLISGLRLLGGENIARIGIFDIDNNKVLRTEYECNQIFSSCSAQVYPQIEIIAEEDLFDCDMFVFCVTAGVPEIGKESSDVRLAQFNANSKIIDLYARKARKSAFKGIFAVVSDPVDPLCKTALMSSNTDENGNYDFLGLAPEQICGYGLGVMNARAAYYAKMENIEYFTTEGRAYGPHGDGLVIADSIYAYNEALSLMLTEKAKNANIEVRKTGFKPYIAPALSSGSISIIETITGKWHYSSTYMGGIFFGAKNRLNDTGIELEIIDLPEELFCRLQKTYERLSDIL